MADASKDDLIVQAYKTDLATQVTGDLSWIRHYALPGETNLPNWYGLTPLVLILPVDTTFEDQCMDGTFRVDKVKFLVRLVCILQVYNMALTTNPTAVSDYRTAMQYGAALNDRYGRRDFGISNAATAVNLRYGNLDLQGIVNNDQMFAFGVELDIEHDYIQQSTPS